MKRNPTIDGMRACTQCGDLYPDTPEYYPYGTRTVDGTVHLRADCRTCYNERARAIDTRRRRLAGIPPRSPQADPPPMPEPRPPRPVTEKRCSVCGQLKPVSEYCRLGGVRLMARCKACHNEANRRARREARQAAIAPPTGLAPYHADDDERRAVMRRTLQLFCGQRGRHTMSKQKPNTPVLPAVSIGWMQKEQAPWRGTICPLPKEPKPKEQKR